MSGRARKGRGASPLPVSSLLTVRRPTSPAPDQRWPVFDSHTPGHLYMVDPARLPARVREALPVAGASAVFHGRRSDDGTFLWGLRAHHRLRQSL